MAKKPIIGINSDFRPEKGDSFAFSWLHAGYFDSISRSGGVPVMLPQLSNDDDLEQVVDMLDGVVLTGCKLDLDPVRLGYDKHPATRPMPARREDFDRRLAQMAFERKLPVLAVGSGMQTLNVICGGSLFQHIAEDILKPLHHRDPVEERLRHLIEIVPGTRMDNIYGPGEIRVNSDHHMAIDQLASMFRVSATCPDGVIEAYESAVDDWFVLAVQFHPESHTASALDMQVFECFIEGCLGQAEESPATIPFPVRRAA
ncbi:MAG: gamma-glutamyl-gamma-aminobutyrate hydrolase family protein [Planctomycetaceae bacterium]